MALGNATAGGGDGSYLKRDEWLEVARQNDVLAVRLLQILDMEPMANGPVYPVIVDFVFLTGARKGEVWRNQKLIGNGQTPPLRKIAVGDDMATTLATSRTGATEYVQFNPCNDRDFAVVAKAFKDVEGTRYDNDPYTAAEAAAQGEPARSNGLVNSGATTSSPKPWDRA